MGLESESDLLLAQLAQREIYIERQFHGPYAQIRAIDGLTGFEVAVTTPASAAQFDQNRLVLRKLGQGLIAQGLMVLKEADRSGVQPQKKAVDMGSSTSTDLKNILPKGGIYT